MWTVTKIVSGGQTGVDRAALDWALSNDVSCGGWCPAGRVAEDGVIDRKYPLEETPGEGYSANGMECAGQRWNLDFFSESTTDWRNTTDRATGKEVETPLPRSIEGRASSGIGNTSRRRSSRICRHEPNRNFECGRTAKFDRVRRG